MLNYFLPIKRPEGRLEKINFDNLHWDIENGKAWLYGKSLNLQWAPEYDFCRVILKHPKHRLKYFDVSCEVELPNKGGQEALWFAFWLYGDNGLPEHDFEYCGNEDHINAIYHWGYDYKGHKRQTKRNKRKIKPGSWTKLGFIIRPNYSKFMVNDKCVRFVPRNNADDQRIIFDLKLGEFCPHGIKPKTRQEVKIKNLEIIKYR